MQKCPKNNVACGGDVVKVVKVVYAPFSKHEHETVMTRVSVCVCSLLAIYGHSSLLDRHVVHFFNVFCVELSVRTENVRGYTNQEKDFCFVFPTTILIYLKQFLPCKSKIKFYPGCNLIFALT